MNWTQRVLEMRERGTGPTMRDHYDANMPNRCLVGEAAALLGLGYGTTSVLLTMRGVRWRGGPVGREFPNALAAGRLADAEAMCHLVEDAVLAMKREGEGPCSPPS